GPKALSNMLPELTTKTSDPIFIVQHMPPKFTESLAKSLDKKCEHTVIEAKNNDLVQNNYAYIAPGGRHLLLRKGAGDEVFTYITDQPPENGCRPSVDILFRSAATVYGGDAIAIVLTGMGSDGAKGLAPLVRKGVHVMVQDEKTSVVWGMPGSAVAAGCVDDVLPLQDIPKAVESVIKRKKG
ncbi:Chemotaxis response regulator protein-glutamate methylesterase CheB, partial [hydrothermal vent metagenome]